MLTNEPCPFYPSQALSNPWVAIGKTKDTPFIRAPTTPVASPTVEAVNGAGFGLFDVPMIPSLIQSPD